MGKEKILLTTKKKLHGYVTSLLNIGSRSIGYFFILYTLNLYYIFFFLCENNEVIKAI